MTRNYFDIAAQIIKINFAFGDFIADFAFIFASHRSCADSANRQANFAINNDNFDNDFDIDK